MLILFLVMKYISIIAKKYLNLNLEFVTRNFSLVSLFCNSNKMGRTTSTKWEKSVAIRPVNYIESSDFPKYQPVQWKFMEGEPEIALLLANEYMRMYQIEQEEWAEKHFPENITTNVDIVKKYVMNFNANYQPPKAVEKKLFKMKKFEEAKSKTTHTRPPGDKAMRTPE